MLSFDKLINTSNTSCDIFKPVTAIMQQQIKRDFFFF